MVLVLPSRVMCSGIIRNQRSPVFSLQLLDQTFIFTGSKAWKSKKLLLPDVSFILLRYWTDWRLCQECYRKTHKSGTTTYCVCYWNLLLTETLSEKQKIIFMQKEGLHIDKTNGIILKRQTYIKYLEFQLHSECLS